jgi:hypothetical protein
MDSWNRHRLAVLRLLALLVHRLHPLAHLRRHGLHVLLHHRLLLCG